MPVTREWIADYLQQPKKNHIIFKDLQLDGEDLCHLEWPDAITWQHVTFVGTRIDAPLLWSLLPYIRNRDISLCGADCRYIQLTEPISWKNIDLTDVNFHKAFLRRHFFSNSILHRVDFSHADLRYVDFRNADIEGADFSYSDILGARF